MMDAFDVQALLLEARECASTFSKQISYTSLYALKNGKDCFLWSSMRAGVAAAVQMGWSEPQCVLVYGWACQLWSVST